MLALMPVCIEGKATLATVPSIKTILEPSIVAASTHRPASPLAGEAGTPAMTAPSSQGCLMMLDNQVLGRKAGSHMRESAATQSLFNIRVVCSVTLEGGSTI